MTLEDFFTLTEGKDGRIAPPRVNELISVMQKERDCIVKNASDTTRQWSTVASTIVATKNQYCLDLFIQLDGLWFIDRWLKEAQSLVNSDGLVEEKIIVLLKAVEKLHIDSNKSISSGIWTTVKNLLGHDSHVVQNSARALFDKWKQGGDDDKDNKNDEIHDTVIFTHVSVPKQSINEENHSPEPACNDILRERNSNRLGKIQDIDVQTLSVQVNSHMSLKSCDVDNRPSVEKSPLTKESKYSNVSTMACNTLVTTPVNLEELSGFTSSNKVKSYMGKSLKTSNSVMEPNLQEKLDDKDDDVTDSITKPAGETNHCKIKRLFHAPDESGGCSSSVLGKNEDSNSASLEQDVKFKDCTGKKEEIFHRASDYLRPVRTPPIDKKPLWMADMGLEYGLVDALVVARKVAEEVEREVNCKETFCSSSSEKLSPGGIRQPSSPESINDKEQFTLSHVEQSGQEPSHSLTNSENAGDDPENCEHDMESSHLTITAQEQDVKTEKREKSLFGFDLNEDFCSEETELSVNHSITATASVVSASRPIAASILPVSPLQFEGTLGWKGSAATSAFRAASPRIITDAGKQKPDFLDFDLNVAESDSVGVEHIPALCPSFPSGESSVEVSSRRSERLNFDLNRVSDEKYALPSPTSSSSHMFHPPIRNIDLNDPSFSHDSSDHGNTYTGVKRAQPVISLMGTRMQVGRKEFTSQAVSMLPNGKMPVETSFGRMGGFLGLGPMAQYHHNNSPPGFRFSPAAPAMSFSPAMYGPSSSIPYVMNSNASPYCQPQFMMSMKGTAMGLNGAGPSHTSFDMNSGLVGEGGLRQFFGDSEGRLIVNSLDRSNVNFLEGLTSGYGEKRKEPDTGWDPYPVANKHQLPPWK